MEQNTSAILEKIKKLMALRDNPGTPEEAANAAARINDLLLRHNLSLAQVIAHDHKRDTTSIQVHTFDLEDYQGRHDGKFGLKLISAIAMFNFCQVVNRPAHRHEYDQGRCDILGKPHNVEICLYMIDYCKTHIVNMEKQYWKNYTGDEKRNSYRRGFYHGAVNAIAIRLNAQKKETIKQTAQEMNVDTSTVENSFAIMVRNDKELIHEELKKRYNNLRAGAAHGKLGSQDGKIHGHEAGSKLDFTKGLGGSNSPATKGFLK